MKRILLILTILFSGAVLVDALLLNSPVSDEYISEGIINVTSELADSNISFYMNNDSFFDDEHKICFYNNTDTGDYTCNFTAYTNDMQSDNLVAHYKFDRDSPLKDETGNNNITVSSGVIHKENGGAILDYYKYGGDGDYLSIPQSSGDFNFGGSTVNFTMSVWVNSDVEVQPNYAYVMREEKQDYGIYAKGVWPSDGYTCIFRSTSSVYKHVQLTTDNDPENWHLLTCSIEGTSPNIVVNGYYDGELVVTDTLPGALSQSSIYDVVYIGRQDAYSSYGFDGSIDELAFWDRALTSEEIKELYKFGDGIYYHNVTDINSTESQSSDITQFYLDLTDPLNNIVTGYEDTRGSIEFISQDANLLGNVSSDVYLDGVLIDTIGPNLINNYSYDGINKGEHNMTIITTDMSGRETITEKPFYVVNSITVKSKNKIIKLFANIWELLG